MNNVIVARTFTLLGELFGLARDEEDKHLTLMFALGNSGDNVYMQIPVDATEIEARAQEYAAVLEANCSKKCVWILEDLKLTAQAIDRWISLLHIKTPGE